MKRVLHENTVVAHHLVLCGYGHWLPNDLRGSGSTEVRMPELAALAPIHKGRKARQPTRGELRVFHREVEQRLRHPVLWYEQSDRETIGAAVGSIVLSKGYTVWACAVLRDHVHLCVRVHRDNYRKMWEVLTEVTREALRRVRPELAVHPIWSERPYSVYLYTPDDIRRTIDYVNGNPRKHGLPKQTWDFVRGYDGWPRHKKK
jgi:REP element-mobilizing transposase RayT